jgi:hypothetical protein
MARGPVERSRIVAVLMMSSLSCGDDDAGAPDLTSFVEELVTELCEYSVRCGRFATEADCSASYSIEGTVVAAQASIDAGRMVFDQAAADLCLARFDATSCADPVALECQPFAGQVPEGGTCYLEEECAGGTCDQSCPSETCCAGACRATAPPMQIGEPCAPGGCITGTFCEATSETCQDVPGNGEPCTGLCEPGFTCEGNGCVPLPAEGQACEVDVTPCASPTLFCDPSVGSGVCVIRHLPGEPCTGGGEGLSECVLWAECAGSVCVELPGGGDSCTPGERCQGFVICNDSGICQVPTPPPCP